MRIGTRGSALALAQARLVAARLGAARREEAELVLVVIATTGDRGADDADKSRWTAELEDALAGGIDLAVHSAKDVPGELAEGLALAGRPRARGAGGRALRGGSPGARRSHRAPAWARAACAAPPSCAPRGRTSRSWRCVATSTPACASSARGELDAIVLARAGLQRLGREAEIARGARPRPLRPRSRPGHARARGTQRTRAHARSGRGDRRRHRLRLPARRARRGARARRQLQHPARRIRAGFRLRLPAPARLGWPSRRLGVGRRRAPRRLLRPRAARAPRRRASAERRRRRAAAEAQEGEPPSQPTPESRSDPVRPTAAASTSSAPVRATRGC